MLRTTTILLLVAAATALAAAEELPAAAGPEAAVLQQRNDSWFRFFPGYYGSLSHRYFFNQKNSFYKERYVSQLDVGMEFIALSFGEQWFVLWDIRLQTGMGESIDSHLPFAVNEVHYRLGPLAEYRRGQTLYRAGLDHSCDHIVHKNTANPWYVTDDGQLVDVYFNRVFAGVGSRDIRLPDFRRQYIGKDRPQPGSLVWYVEGGYYLRSLFNIIRSDSLWEGNEWEWDLRGELRCTLWSGEWCVLFLNDECRLLVDLDGDTYWQNSIAAEVIFARGGGGTGFFLNATPLDEHPRDSRDQTIELGFRVFY